MLVQLAMLNVEVVYVRDTLGAPDVADVLVKPKPIHTYALFVAPVVMWQCYLFLAQMMMMLGLDLMMLILEAGCCCAGLKLYVLH